MSAAVTTAKPAGPADPAEPAAEAAPPPKSRFGRKKLLLLGVPVLLAAVGAGLWFGGVLPGRFGPGRPVAAAAGPGAGAGAPGAAAPNQPAYVELPEMVANLNAGTRRNSYVKLRARLELAAPADEATLKADMPRLMDLFQTYLREMRPEELQGSAGSYRLREELIARANIALAPVRVTDVLFTEMLVQ
jgi:flagellar FliL protein